jgi:hypothetical protein
MARKVLNPTGALGAHVSSYSLSTSDGARTYSGPADAALAHAASIDTAGAVHGLQADLALPVVPIPDFSGTSSGFYYEVDHAMITPFIDSDLVGAVNPFTGAATASLSFHLKGDFHACVYYGSDSSGPQVACHTTDTTHCFIGAADAPIALSFSTAGPGGAPYNEVDGTAVLSDHQLALPASQSCGDGFGPASSYVEQQVNAQVGLPSASGHTTLALGLGLDPIIRRGVIAALVATPGAPLSANFDATGSQVPAGVQSYAFNTSGDPAASFETLSGNGLLGVAFPTAGPHTVRVKVTDVDGDSDTAAATVDVAAPPPIVAPPPATFAAGDIVKLPAGKRCRTSRKLRLKVTVPAGAAVSSIRLAVGKIKKTVTGAAVAKPITLARLPKGRYTVTVTVILSDGRKLIEHRSYRTCPKKKK